MEPEKEQIEPQKKKIENLSHEREAELFLAGKKAAERIQSDDQVENSSQEEAIPTSCWFEIYKEVIDKKNKFFPDKFFPELKRYTCSHYFLTKDTDSIDELWNDFSAPTLHELARKIQEVAVKSQDKYPTINEFEIISAISAISPGEEKEEREYDFTDNPEDNTYGIELSAEELDSFLIILTTSVLKNSSLRFTYQYEPLSNFPNELIIKGTRKLTKNGNIRMTKIETTDFNKAIKNYLTTHPSSRSDEIAKALRKPENKIRVQLNKIESVEKIGKGKKTTYCMK